MAGPSHARLPRCTSVPGLCFHRCTTHALTLLQSILLKQSITNQYQEGSSIFHVTLDRLHQPGCFTGAARYCLHFLASDTC